MRRSGIIPPTKARPCGSKPDNSSMKSPALSMTPQFYSHAPLIYCEPFPTTVVDDYASGTYTSATANMSLRPVITTLQTQLRSLPGASSTLRDVHIDSVCPIHENVALDQSQRMSYYDTLSRVLGPADGVQERVGSYSAYMAKQTEIYYERVLSPPGSASDVCSTPYDALYRPRSAVTGAPSRPIGLGFISCQTSSFYVDSPYWSEGPVKNPQGASLELSDILISPVMAPVQLPRKRTVSFATPALETFGIPSTLATQSPASFYQSSSSLAGALGETQPPVSSDHETRRRNKEWSRPRMGRARAYSAGGGM